MRFWIHFVIFLRLFGDQRSNNNFQFFREYSHGQKLLYSKSLFKEHQRVAIKVVPTLTLYIQQWNSINCGISQSCVNFQISRHLPPGHAFVFCHSKLILIRYSFDIIPLLHIHWQKDAPSKKKEGTGITWNLRSVWRQGFFHEALWIKSLFFLSSLFSPIGQQRPSARAEILQQDSQCLWWMSNQYQNEAIMQVNYSKVSI